MQDEKKQDGVNGFLSLGIITFLTVPVNSFHTGGGSGESRTMAFFEKVGIEVSCAMVSMTIEVFGGTLLEGGETRKSLYGLR
jgi:hypothetical protein